jgi:hypothetical protein
MSLQLSGRTLFVFSDPGGAKPILSYIFVNNIVDYKIITDRQYDFFADFGLLIDLFNNEEIDRIVERVKPDYIMTGTSYTSKIELNFLKSAKKRGILTITFIDHYTRYLDRFELNGEYIFPDKIWVTDFKALSIAESFNLDKHSELEVTGNFFHKFLENWQPSINRRHFINDLEIEDDTKVIVFAPDPLSNVGGKDKFGFDETDIWDLISEALKNEYVLKKFLVVVKLHPNQNENYIKEYIRLSDYPNVIFANDYQINTTTLIYYSSIVIGMYSSFLIEAFQFKKKIIRLLLNKRIEDSLDGMNIGHICYNCEELHIRLNEVL